jgi:hypothetical protein
MAIKQVNTSIRMSADTKAYFDESFEASGANSKGEFITMMLERYNNPGDPVTVEKIVEVEKRTEQNEIFINLSPAQLFALRNTVLSGSDFAQKQNDIIDWYASKDNKPFLYPGSLFEPEFQSLWVKNKIITNQMTGEEKEAVIKFNMAAFLLNVFLMTLIKGEMPESLVDAVNLKAYIISQTAKAKPKPTPAVTI